MKARIIQLHGKHSGGLMGREGVGPKIYFSDFFGLEPEVLGPVLNCFVGCVAAKSAGCGVARSLLGMTQPRPTGFPPVIARALPCALKHPFALTKQL